MLIEKNNKCMNEIDILLANKKIDERTKNSKIKKIIINFLKYCVKYINDGCSINEYEVATSYIRKWEVYHNMLFDELPPHFPFKYKIQSKKVTGRIENPKSQKQIINWHSTELLSNKNIKSIIGITIDHDSDYNYLIPISILFFIIAINSLLIFSYYRNDFINLSELFRFPITHIVYLMFSFFLSYFYFYCTSEIFVEEEKKLLIWTFIYLVQSLVSYTFYACHVNHSLNISTFFSLCLLFVINYLIPYIINELHFYTYDNRVNDNLQIFFKKKFRNYKSKKKTLSQLFKIYYRKKAQIALQYIRTQLEESDRNSY